VTKIKRSSNTSLPLSSKDRLKLVGDLYDQQHYVKAGHTAWRLIKTFLKVAAVYVVLLLIIKWLAGASIVDTDLSYLLGGLAFSVCIAIQAERLVQNAFVAGQIAGHNLHVLLLDDAIRKAEEHGKHTDNGPMSINLSASVITVEEEIERVAEMKRTGAWSIDLEPPTALSDERCVCGQRILDATLPCPVCKTVNVLSMPIPHTTCTDVSCTNTPL
jgi:hypothetical protein